jgi:hypothetical protein
MTDRRLLRHLTVAVVLKLVVLAALWWAFVRDARVQVDADTAAARVTAAVQVPAAGVVITAGAHR